MTSRFWRDDPDAEWAMLLRVVDTHCHPEAAEDEYENLQHLAKAYADTDKMRTFKHELRQAILNPERLPKGALALAAAYDDGSQERFLARLWHDLYPDEPLPS